MRRRVGVSASNWARRISMDQIANLFLGNAVKYENIRGQLLAECAELGQYSRSSRSLLY